MKNLKIILSRELIALCILLVKDISGGDYCDDYLVSGPTGVPDDRLSASSSIELNYQQRQMYSPQTCQPATGRLFLSNTIPGSGLRLGTAWCRADDDENGYLQVDFDNTKILKAIKTQGRGDASQWVVSYSITYKLDGDWLTIQNSQHEEMVFTGNNDSTTVVTHYLPVNIEAKSVRIQPKSFVHRPSLRFDIIGCKKINRENSSEVWDEPKQNVTWRIHPIEIGNLGIAVWNRTVSHLGACALLCHKLPCRSFTFDSMTKNCTAFQDGVINGGMIGVKLSNLYFIRVWYWKKYLNILRTYEYHFESNVIFRVFTRRANAEDASRICMEYNTTLLTIRDITVLRIVQNFLQNNIILLQSTKFKVDGKKQNGSWRFSDGTDIPSYLWGPGQPSEKYDKKCASVNKKGLEVTDCSVLSYFVCGFEILKTYLE